MSIADYGRWEMAARKEKTARKLWKAMQEIEAEIDLNRGLYTYNEGRLSQQELLRRAGVSNSALQKSTHSELRAETNAWLRQIEHKIKIGAKSVRAEVTERVRTKDEELEKLMQRWAEAELQYREKEYETSALLAKQSQRITELEAELASCLSRQLHLIAGKRVRKKAEQGSGD